MQSDNRGNTRVRRVNEFELCTKNNTSTWATGPTFTGQLGGREAQPEHRAVSDQTVLQLVHTFVSYRVMAEVQSLQTLSARLRETRGQDVCDMKPHSDITATDKPGMS